MLRILALFIALLATPPVAAAASTGKACDHLAGHPYDPANKAQGVAFDAIDPPVALMSCAAAYSSIRIRLRDFASMELFGMSMRFTKCLK